MRVIPVKHANNTRESALAYGARVGEGEKERRDAPERAEKVLCVRMHKAMRHNLVLEHPQLFLARQSAIYEQVRRLEVRRMQRKLLDPVAAVSQNARLAIDVRDLALYDGGIEETFVGHAEALGGLVLCTFPWP